MKDNEVIAEALKDMHQKEPFEKLLGRAVRRNDGKYEDYLRIMGSVRDLAYASKLSILQAAKELAAQP